MHTQQEQNMCSLYKYVLHGRRRTVAREGPS
jgi:hypothetical protein